MARNLDGIPKYAFYREEVAKTLEELAAQARTELGARHEVVMALRTLAGGLRQVGSPNDVIAVIEKTKLRVCFPGSANINYTG